MNQRKVFGQLILKRKSGKMNCVICKTGAMHEGQVTVTLEKNGSIILIKEVPAHICDVCEHYYLDESITEEVLKRGQEGILKGAELEVLKLKVA
jgi:YgiT-type zinc finger domain-containing protein